MSKLNIFIVIFVLSQNAELDKTVNLKYSAGLGLLKTVLSCRQFSSQRRHGENSLSHLSSHWKHRILGVPSPKNY